MLIVTQLAKYLFIILLLLFSLRDYTYFRYRTEEKRRKAEGRQLFDIYVFDILGFGIIFMNTWDMKVALLLAGIFIYMAFTSVFYKVLYPKASILLVNNMLMLLSVGFVMIARINLTQAIKQFIIAAAGTALALLVPVIVRKVKILQRLTWLYAVIGLLALGAVFALATISGGAKLSIEVGGITIQFSEIVKITLVFFLASKLARDTSRGSVVVATVVAFMHVGLLVLSRDLGTAAVFYIAYLAVLLAATRKAHYTAIGILGGGAAAAAAYFLFSHVRLRVQAWRDPFSLYDGAGYQIVHGLFAIGAGGWFGTGLCQGSPGTIPVAVKDEIFAAICEEFGTVFGICLILVCMSMFILIVNMSMQIRRRFYKLISLGLGVEYAFQVFLTIGGVTIFIPLTGITLPLVSYGGSSVVSTIFMLAIIQGLYILREDEEDELTRAVASQVPSDRGQEH
ncbi:MAG: FtsW/RodA/SpoVE family cell cycle protein [Lachnospiraceae bacterium]|nr:FtsW/RodA/SpoVE family cell cycle protein [Lachnospiraceae bacterium]